MRAFLLVVAGALVLGASAAPAAPTGQAAGRIPVTADYFDGTKRVITIASERPRKNYRVTVKFTDTGERIVRRMRSGETIRLEVGNRPHQLVIRCIPKRKRRG